MPSTDSCLAAWLAREPDPRLIDIDIQPRYDLRMNAQMIINIIILAALALITALLLAGKKKDDISEISDLLRAAEQAQRDNVARQLSDGATEQFRRFGLIQESVQATLQSNRTETNERLSAFSSGLDTRLSSMQEQLDNRLSLIQRANAENIDKVNSTLESKMKTLQDSNEKRLEQMRGVVDEKLQKTLEVRLTQSFELVSKQLDSVQQGLGEMKSLAADARSLRNTLINVKERGTYGELRLEKLLSDILAPGQYESNVEIADGKRVEFAIRLPGSGDEPLLLPIDSKFPVEDYNRLLDAEDKQGIEDARKALTQKIRAFAKDISEKYITPPKTTDFALMFLPTEGLYAEVVQNAALFEELRDKYKITAVGATTLSAFLSSLQMGFKTLAIEQRSREVWDTLSAVKLEFEKFAGALEKAHKQIQSADKTIVDIVGTRTNAINRRLRSVGELSSGADPDSSALSGLDRIDLTGQDMDQDSDMDEFLEPDQD